MSLDKSEQLLVRKGTISCLQYPGDRHPPILQAMNISTAQNNLVSQLNLGWSMSPVMT
jgi:probable phosphoglycerate mutase